MTTGLAMKPAEISQLSAQQILVAIRNSELTAVETVEASLNAIAEMDPALHAFITVCAGDARLDAVRLDQRARAGEPLGPLHGVPVAIKDLVSTAGVRTTRGSLRYINDIPEADDLVVERLKRAGAVIIGKANTPEFGFGALCKNEIAGNTANPYNHQYSSGGSSGGSAAAVAAGMVPLAHGTDFGGSVRTPASFCNVVGYRPSAGLVPRVPKSLPWDTVLSHGILARSIEDAALMLKVMSGADSRDPTSLYARSINVPDWTKLDPREVRLKTSLNLGVTEIDHEVADLFDAASNAIAMEFPNVANGHPDFAGAASSFDTLRAAILFNDFGHLLDAEGPPLSETVQWNVGRGRHISARDVFAAETLRGEIYQRCVSFFEDTDVLVTVSASVPPFSITQENVESINGKPMRNVIDYLAITYVVSLVGLPAVSIPAGMTNHGLPIGIQLVAGPGCDCTLLLVAAAIQNRLGFRHDFFDPALT